MRVIRLILLCIIALDVLRFVNSDSIHNRFTELSTNIWKKKQTSEKYHLHLAFLQCICTPVPCTYNQQPRLELWCTHTLSKWYGIFKISVSLPLKALFLFLPAFCFFSLPSMTPPPLYTFLGFLWPLLNTCNSLLLTGWINSNWQLGITPYWYRPTSFCLIMISLMLLCNSGLRESKADLYSVFCFLFLPISGLVRQCILVTMADR